MHKNQISKIKLTIRNLSLTLFTTTLISACSNRTGNEDNITALTTTNTSNLNINQFMLKASTANKIQIRLDGAPKNFKAVPEIRNNFNALKKNAYESMRLVSNKNKVLVIEHGRLISTSNFNENLVSIETTKTDPLALGLLNSKTPKTWTRSVHWSSQKQAVEVTSTFAYIGEQSILIQHVALDTYLFLETVIIPSLGKNFVNQFWLDKHNGRLVKSVQHISPSQPKMTLLILQ